MLARYTEKALLLGPNKSMVGIMTRRAETDPAVDRPLVVILNSGIVHRAGPNRLGVLLARDLATRGFDVLRFDLSGLGDSELRKDSLAPFDAAMADIREALDTLDVGAKPLRVVLAGLCSGADHALFYGGTDPRVVGMAMIDPSIPRTVRYHLNHYRTRLLRGRNWIDLVRGRLTPVGALKRLLKGPAAAAPEDGTASSDLQIDHPTVRAALKSAYEAALQAQAAMLTVCTADLESRVNYREQLTDAFPRVDFGTRLRLEYFADADHTFTMEVQRLRLIRLVGDWLLGTAFRSSPPEPSPPTPIASWNAAQRV